jgi:ACS family sodium-dependent inorganic phosphate cotransporter
MAERFGYKWVYGLGMFLSGLATLLSPIVSQTSFEAFFALRAFIGLCEGVTIPSLMVASAR